MLTEYMCMKFKFFKYSIINGTYQNRSPFLKLENCCAIMQANVGPTSPPTTGLSAIPAVNKSISSTCLKIYL